MKKIIVTRQSQLDAIAAHYHSAYTLQVESGRSRSWVYKIMSELPCVLVVDANSGRSVRMVRRESVRQLLITRRPPGNPSWKR